MTNKSTDRDAPRQSLEAGDEGTDIAKGQWLHWIERTGVTALDCLRPEETFRWVRKSSFYDRGRPPGADTSLSNDWGRAPFE